MSLVRTLTHTTSPPFSPAPPPSDTSNRYRLALEWNAREGVQGSSDAIDGGNARNMLGLALQDLGQHVEARAVFTRGRALFPTHFALLVNSGALENRCELVFIIFIYCTTKFFINLM